MEDKQQHMYLQDSDESIHVSSWDDNKVWMNLSLSRASARVVLTKEETQALIEMLQTAMAEAK
jgi:hypothetical protein